ncbi:Tetraketide alpha-pyrone reductase 1 [Ananas comosus]|uniref:Tetraketide alpha-pyrone reductase 1 n=1 Tax=Ananas comosus TaxID=4615 RepID=A0A199UWM7_ANACO|nr:Tetraketide alpha-pyrone reductase 1 [Ananas comosus]
MSMQGSSSLRVCVTGGSGFIGSWLLRFLLQRGYSVHATVKNLKDEGETKHLEALDGAASRLWLFEMDLLDPTSILAAVNGTAGVFHLASPLILDGLQDPEKELLDPAVKGTLNVLRAAKECGVGRVVLVSSQAAMIPNPDWPVDVAVNEDSWADVDLLKKLQLWYCLSKTLAEKAAWEFASKEGLELVVINPGMVLGPILPPFAGASVKILLHLLQGAQFDMDNLYIGSVDVRDVAQALILLYENRLAQGRHLCLERIERWIDFVAKLAELYPEFPVKRVEEDKQSWVVRAESPSKKLIELGLHFTPLEKLIEDTVESLKSKGYLK